MRSWIKIMALLILMSDNRVFAEDMIREKTHDFGVNLGLTEFQLKEFVLNKVKHSGAFPSFGLSYETHSEFLIHSIKLTTIFSTLSSRFEQEKASFVINPAIQYSYSRMIPDLIPGFSVFMGGITGLDATISYFENWDESHYYWLTAYYAGITGALLYKKLNDRYFTLEVQLPLLALVSRPPEHFIASEVNPEVSSILSTVNEHLQVTSLHRHFDLKFNLVYTFSYSNLFKQSLYWRLRYLNNRMPYSKKLIILTHTFGAVFLF